MEWYESLRIQADVLEEIAKDKTVKSDISKFVKILTSVKGFHYFTGVGKNGHIAAHVASTFNSLGIRSMFVDPVNTLHGDMHIFSKGDMVIAISKSGETEELIRFINALHKIGFKNIVGITSTKNSSLAKLSQYALIIPISSEGDAIGLTPIASTLAYLAFLQAVGVSLSSKRGFTKAAFIRGHPGGSIGRGRA